MKILITGDQGFVGRHFHAALAGKGHNIHGIDIKRGRDCRDLFKNSDIRYDLIIHLAAVVGGRETIEREPLKVAVDLSIDAEFFQFVLRTQPKKVVYFSSSAAYPIVLQDGFPRRSLYEDDIDLTNIESPDMTYGFAKLAGEYQAHFASILLTGITDFLVFRPFSGYGEDQDLSYPFPSFIQRAVRREDPFEIWGNGNACRDFIHIDDVVNAVLKAVDDGIKGTFNLGTGRAVSFNELSNFMTFVLGHKPEIQHRLDKPVGVQYRVADTRRMRQFYIPQITLEEGIWRALRAA